jgi:hypothetical protein
MSYISLFAAAIPSYFRGLLKLPCVILAKERALENLPFNGMAAYVGYFKLLTIQG